MKGSYQDYGIRLFQNSSLTFTYVHILCPAGKRSQFLNWHRNRYSVLSSPMQKRHPLRPIPHWLSVSCCLLAGAVGVAVFGQDKPGSAVPYLDPSRDSTVLQM